MRHAGKTVIKVTLDYFRTPLYNATSTYVTVDVQPAPLTVTSYAYIGSSDGAPITKARYGNLTSIHSALSYEGLVNGDDATSFTHGHG